jgi:hypothetical protein
MHLNIFHIPGNAAYLPSRMNFRGNGGRAAWRGTANK